MHQKSYFKSIQGADYHQGQDGAGTDEDDEADYAFDLLGDDILTPQGNDQFYLQDDNQNAANGTHAEALPPLNIEAM